jgi:hypothetical protein
LWCNLVHDHSRSLHVTIAPAELAEGRVHRLSSSLDDKQYVQVSEIAHRNRVSIAWVVREAIERLLADNPAEASIMSDAADAPALFTDLPAGTEILREQKLPIRKSVAGRNGTQLRMFAEMNGDIRNGFDLDLAPLDATFRDSSEAPLHSWFPYIEGYSPRFVERIRHEYLGDAKRIVEPFAGTGTTPIVLGQAGVACAFSEANPAMVFIAQTKLTVLGLAEPKRDNLAQRIIALAQELPQRVSIASPDESLRAAYAPSFGATCSRWERMR